MTHGHVADNLTIYGNNAYISGGECDLEVDTYMYSRATGKQVQEGGAYLEKNITINAYELDNLSVWGQRNTAYTVNVNLTDCDGKEIAGNNNVQRVYISGTAGVNNFTITGCDFLTKATSIYSNADGEIVVSNCTFTGAQAPLNINHKADGAVTLEVTNSTFTSCGDNGDWAQYAAPARFVNSGSGTMTVTANKLTFDGTVGKNGDILLGDGRKNQKSNEVTLTVTNTAANIQAQKPGYYNDDGTTNETKGGTLVAVATESYTTTVEDLAPLTDYVVVGGIAGFEGKKFASFEEAYNAIKPIIGTLGLGQESASATAFDAIFTDRDENGNAKLTYTIKGNVVYDETGLSYLLTMGRKASHYGNDRHLIKFAFVGVTADKKDTLTVNSNITLPYEWWGEKIATSISFENLTITGSAPNGLYPSQAFFEGIDFTVNNCTLNGIKIYNCSNVGGSYTITNSVLDGTGAPANAYAIHLQGNETAPLTINISGNTISGYDRGVNIDQDTANATISNNAISVKDAKRSCIQLTRLAETTIADNNLNLTGGNAITLYKNLAEGSKITVQANIIDGNGYLIYDDTQKAIDLTYGENTVAATVDMTKGVYGDTTKDLSDDVYNEVHHVLAEVNGVKFATLAEAVNAVSDGGEIVVYSGVYTIPNVTYTGKSFTISAGVGQTVSFDMSVAHAIPGAKVSFNNVTFDYKTNGNYIGLQHADTLTYNGCTINGMVFLYATNETFNGCTFNQDSKDAYNVWTYGAKNVAFNQCVFNSAGKSVLVYNEGANPKTDLTVSETKFVASEKVDGKAAIEIDTSFMAGGTTITIDDKTTATNFAAGSNSGNTLWNDKKQTADTNKNTTITVADEVVFAPYVVAIGEVKYFSLTAAIAAAKDGETVKLLADIDGNFVIEAGKDFTLDLNGFTLNGGTGTAKAAITNKGTLTIIDSSATKTGTIKRDDNGIVGETSYYVIRNLGTMTIEQANVINNSGYRKTNPSGSMIGSSLICNGDNDEGASLTINGGKLTQLNFLAVKNGANGTLVVNGGEITSNHSAIQNWCDARITGGTIKGQLWTDAYIAGESVGNTVLGGDVQFTGEIVMDITGAIKPELTINGGNLSVTNWRITTACAELGGKPAVKGGTFSSEVNKDYLADGFVINQNENKTYGVREGSGFAGANVVVTESLAMKVVVGTASKYVVVTYKGLDGIAKTVRLDKFTDIRIEGKDYKYCLFDQIMPQMIDVKFSFELYGENDVMLDRKANYSVVDYLADIIKSNKDSAKFRNVAASLIEYANKAMAVKGLTTTVAPTFVDKDGNTVTLDYNAFVAKNKIPAKDTLGAISEGSGQVIYKARVVFDDAYTLKFYTNAGDGKYTYTLSKNGSTEEEDITFDKNGEFTINVLAQDITTQYVIKVYGEDKTKPIQTVTYGVSTYCIRMQGTETPQGELYVASYYYGVAVQQYGAPNTASV